MHLLLVFLLGIYQIWKQCTTVRAIIDDVRTFLDDPDTKQIVRNIKLLRARFEPKGALAAPEQI